jgi:hypothetical protein
VAGQAFGPQDGGKLRPDAFESNQHRRDRRDGLLGSKHGVAVELATDLLFQMGRKRPAVTMCFDIFSPPAGSSEVISHFERESSNETKIAPR